MKLTKNLNNNLTNIKKLFYNSQDVVIKEFKCDFLNCALLYLKGLADVSLISNFVTRPMQEAKNLPKQNTHQFIVNNIINFPEINTETDLNELINQITKGKAVLMFNGESVAYLIELDSPKERSLSEPPTSAVLKGPREGFNENLKTNMAVIRKIFSTNSLKTEMLTVGKYTTTQICVMYLNGVADKTIVKQIVNKIKSIKIDGVIDSYYILEFLKPHKQSMFKQIGTTEKPDIACAKMLEGRVVVLVDGSPLVITLPFVLLEDFQAADDYYNISAHATFVRILRVVSCLITVLLPGLYIAMQMFHYKAIPLKFLITMVNSTQGLPLTPVTEILFVLVLFEILYEASLRMPEYLGIALSVVGALILGDTAVKAGLISPPAVMIVALSGITLYTIPEQSQQLSLLRFLFTITGATLGFYGLIVLSIFFVVYLNDFDNYKAPYLSPFAPYVKPDFKDGVVKQPLTKMEFRPKTLKNKNVRRLKWNLKELQGFSVV